MLEPRELIHRDHGLGNGNADGERILDLAVSFDTSIGKSGKRERIRIRRRGRPRTRCQDCVAADMWEKTLDTIVVGDRGR